MNFSMTDYIRDRSFEDISKSASAGDTRVENAILYGNANLEKAVDMADMLKRTAAYSGDATRYAGSELGNASMFGGAMEGISSAAYGAFKGGHFGGGGGGGGVPGDGGDAAGFTMPGSKGYEAFESGTPSFGGDYTYDFSKRFYP